jgi:hypothetical protein
LVGNEHLINLKHCSKWQLNIKGLLTKRRKDEIMWGGLYSEAKIVISQASKKKKKKRLSFPNLSKNKKFVISQHNHVVVMSVGSP